MPVYNADIAAVFDEIADLLEIESANPFRVRAYRNAARDIAGSQPGFRRHDCAGGGPHGTTRHR